MIPPRIVHRRQLRGTRHVRRSSGSSEPEPSSLLASARALKTIRTEGRRSSLVQPVASLREAKDRECPFPFVAPAILLPPHSSLPSPSSSVCLSRQPRYHIFPSSFFLLSPLSALNAVSAEGVVFASVLATLNTARSLLADQALSCGESTGRKFSKWRQVTTRSTFQGCFKPLLC